MTQLVDCWQDCATPLPENGVGVCFQWKDADWWGTMRGRLIIDYSISRKLGLIIKRQVFHRLTLFSKPTIKVTATTSKYSLLTLLEACVALSLGCTRSTNFGEDATSARRTEVLFAARLRLNIFRCTAQKVRISAPVKVD